MPLSILLAIADQALGDQLAAQLTADGHDTRHAKTSGHARVLLAQQHVHVLVLARLERPTAALELLRALRAGDLDPNTWAQVPAVHLADSIDDLAALRAYEAGADHHLPTTVGFLQLRAVIDAVHRRASLGTTGPRVRRVGPITIDTAARTVMVDGQHVVLSAKEYALLTMLASDPRRVFTKGDLLRDVWGYRAPSRSRTVDSHAIRLRHKLAGHDLHMVENIWGVGYRLTSIDL